MVQAIDPARSGLNGVSAGGLQRMAGTETSPRVDFAAVMNEAITRVSDDHHAASGLANDFAAEREGVELHDVMIGLQKANISLQQMIQVRNRLVSAYHDIMNMQI